MSERCSPISASTRSSARARPRSSSCPTSATASVFTFDGKPVSGGGFLQAYEFRGGTERGRYDDGRLAVAEHTHGKGRTLLVGTHPVDRPISASPSDDNRRYFADVFAWTGKEQHVQLSNPVMQARVHRTGDAAVLWVINPTRSAQKASVVLGDQRASKLARVLWGDRSAVAGIEICVPPRDALVVQLA